MWENEHKMIGTSITTKMNINDFIIRDSWGNGSFGEVFTAILKSNRKKYALKVINKNLINKLGKHHYIIIEKSIWYYFNSNNIIKLYYTFQDDLNLYFVWEYVKNGTLNSYMNLNGPLKIDLVRNITKQIILILKELRENGITHRDLKPENLLLDNNMKVKLIDFGTSKIIENKKNIGWIKNWKKLSKKYDKIENQDFDEEYWKKISLAGSPFYIAPEVINNTDVYFSCDYWSWGILVYKMLHGRFPLEHKFLLSTYQEIDIYYKKNLHNDAINFIKGLLVVNPFKRLGMDDNDINGNFEALLNHPFLNPPCKKIEIKLSPKLNDNNLYKSKNQKIFNSNKLTNSNKNYKYDYILYENYIKLKIFKFFKIKRYIILNSLGDLLIYNKNKKLRRKFKINSKTNLKIKGNIIIIYNNYFNKLEFITNSEESKQVLKFIKIVRKGIKIKNTSNF